MAAHSLVAAYLAAVRSFEAAVEAAEAASRLNVPHISHLAHVAMVAADSHQCALARAIDDVSASLTEAEVSAIRGVAEASDVADWRAAALCTWQLDAGHNAPPLRHLSPEVPL